MKGISRIDIEGLKSIGGRLSLNLDKLTVLAGANSSGKSMVTP
jgi:predicted ATPase